MTTDEEKISRLYKQGKEPGPTTHLDKAILSAARNAVQDDTVQGRRQDRNSTTARSPLIVSPFSGGWRASASIVAVLVIAVILVPLLQQEETSPTVSRVADGVSVLKKEQNLIEASDIKRPGEAKESREVNIKAKKRVQISVLEQEQESQLHQAPAKTLNTNAFSSGRQFSAEEKIAPVRTPPDISESPLSPAQKTQPATAVLGGIVHDQQQKVAAEIKQHSRGAHDADKRSSVTLAVKPWLQKIRQLIAQGDLDLAQKELDEFKLRYPDEDIDPLIVNQLK
ncbi:MAG: hypothetical protein QNL62_10150 [Gammaproteobacteria bacterium]|nr:hypothetical protein [Gammaproteobacteria bacterium]